MDPFRRSEDRPISWRNLFRGALRSKSIPPEALANLARLDSGRNLAPEVDPV